MRIGILGAPGSGKSKLARTLAKEFDLTAVDNYVQRLQKKTDLALGPWSSYSELFMVAGQRLAEEEKVKTDRVTVGTMVDTLVYAAVRSDVTMHRDGSDRQAVYLAAQAAMQGLSLMFTETWDYDICFHLPYTDEQKRKKQGTWEAAVDGAYLTVIESFQVPYAYTIGGPLEDRISIAKETINLVRNHQSESTPPEERSVRSGGSDVPSIGDPDQAVPDVPSD